MAALPVVGAPMPDPMHPTCAAAITFLLTLTAGAVFVRPSLYELSVLREENRMQASQLSAVRRSQQVMSKRIQQLAGSNDACARGRESERRQRASPKVLLSMLANNTVPTKRRPLSPARVATLRAKHKKRIEEKKAKHAKAKGDGGAPVATTAGK